VRGSLLNGSTTLVSLYASCANPRLRKPFACTNRGHKPPNEHVLVSLFGCLPSHPSSAHPHVLRASKALGQRSTHASSFVISRVATLLIAFPRLKPQSFHWSFKGSTPASSPLGLNSPHSLPYRTEHTSQLITCLNVRYSVLVPPPVRGPRLTLRSRSSLRSLR